MVSSLCSVSSGMRWTDNLLLLFVLWVVFEVLVILNAVTTSELSWVSPGVGEQVYSCVPAGCRAQSLRCSEGGEKVGSKGCASSSCAKQALPEVGASSEQPPHRLVWWSFVQNKSVFVLCESLMFLFSYRLYVCEDGCKSWHHLVVSVAALQPEFTSFHHSGGVNAPGALPQERHKIFPENQSAQSYLITIILNVQ